MSAITEPIDYFARQRRFCATTPSWMKLRVTSLIVMTAWCGYYFGAQKAGVSSLSWGLFTPCWESVWYRVEPPR